jgi:hypothetical protein
MDTGFLIFLIIIWIGSGVIGLVFGAIVGKLVAGFFLGLFLGPIGWIIVFLLPRDAPPKQSQGKRPERDLGSDAYKVWLGKQYNITKNDLFDKYECDGELFRTLNAALEYADTLVENDPDDRLWAENQLKTDNKFLVATVIGITFFIFLLIFFS